MGTLLIRITTVDRIRGGGSGGGPNRNLYPKPEPQAVLGLNSTVVYGSNVQVAFPINFQMALGSNLQVCISPNAWATLFADDPSVTMPEAVTRIMGSGLGGNMQLTMGTSANFVMGQSFDINLGPQRITLDVHNNNIQSCVKTWGIVIMAAAVVFLIAYAAGPDDDFRSILCMAFQVLMQASIIVLMDLKKIYTAMDQSFKSTLDQLFGWNPDTKTGPTFLTKMGGQSSLGEALAATAVAAAMVLPIVLEISGEVRLADPDPPEVVVNMRGHQIGTVQD
ncbi:MAG TPA: hypothetical protein VMT32_18625 [Bryobacteraceae bacterium]|nr:hypothetical protein [Bryobacteraceae bacterium]